MSRKENYISPKMEIINFDAEDVITTSGVIEESYTTLNPEEK